MTSMSSCSLAPFSLARPRWWTSCSVLPLVTAGFSLMGALTVLVARERVTATSRRPAGVAAPSRPRQGPERSLRRRHACEVGDVARRPPCHDLAIYYADDERGTILSPGIVAIGAIDSGLDSIASDGGDFPTTIERTD